MKVFEDKECWGGKINFIDEADTLVGFDAYQSCCESFGHYFVEDPTHKQEQEVDLSEADLAPLFFDVEFFNERDEGSDWMMDGGGEAIFRLFNPNDPDTKPVYLVLFNHHNGYYSHGFEMKTGGTQIHSGAI